MSKTCMFCPSEDGNSEAWGMSQEGIEEMRKRHVREHCFQCPTCGQPIQKTTPQENKQGII